jgi:hypothetical protein
MPEVVKTFECRGEYMHLRQRKYRITGWLNQRVDCMGEGRNKVRRCIQKFPDWPPAVRTANGTALCQYVQLYRYFVSQSSEFCRHNSLCCFSTSVYCCKLIFRYRLSSETFGYTLVCSQNFHRKTSDRLEGNIKMDLGETKLEV